MKLLGPLGISHSNEFGSLMFPPKVRVFWWRVIYEFLPTKQVLHRRHIEPVAFCDTCGCQEESIGHVLMDCTITKTFWEMAKQLTGVKLLKLHPTTWA